MAEFLKNTTLTLLTRITTVVLGMAATAIIARALGPQGQGIYSLATLLPAVLLIFSNFGLGTAALFHVGKKEHSAKVVFGSSILFAAAIGTAAMAAGAVVVYFFGNKFFPGVDQSYLYLALFLLPFYIFFDIVGSILLGLQKIGKYNVVTLLQPFLFLVLLAISFLDDSHRIAAAIMVQTVSFAAAGAFLFVVVFKEIGRPSANFSRKYFYDAVPYGLKSWLASVFNFLHYRADLFLINFLMNPAAAGIYFAATRVSEGVWMLSTSASTVLFPRVAGETDKESLKKFTPFVCRNVFFTTAVMALATFAVCRWLVLLLFSDKFLEAVYPLQVLLIGGVFISGWRILANDIAARGKPMINTYTTGFSLIVNIILNILWIPQFGIAGAAYATSVSYFAIFAATVFIYARVSGNGLRPIFLIGRDDIAYYRAVLSAIKKKL